MINNKLTLEEVNHVLNILQKDRQEHSNYFDFIIETKTDTIPLLFRQAFQEYVDKCGKELENQKKLTNHFGDLFNQLQEDNGH
jgi:predicted ATP-dependent protease